MTKKTYPSDFPNGVPPESSTPAQGEAYRLVNNNPPKEPDFIGYYKEPFLKRIPKKLNPGFFGTSMYRDFNSLEISRDLYPNLRDKLIAHGVLRPEFGVTSKESPKSHFDLWLREKTGIEKDFKVVSKKQ